MDGELQPRSDQISFRYEVAFRLDSCSIGTCERLLLVARSDFDMYIANQLVPYEYIETGIRISAQDGTVVCCWRSAEPGVVKDIPEAPAEGGM